MYALLSPVKYTNIDIARLQSEIEKAVYQLYDLTPEEIAAVEGGEAT